jgi:hypothetical protein
MKIKSALKQIKSFLAEAGPTGGRGLLVGLALAGKVLI